jgi:hypothetical protein
MKTKIKISDKMREQIVKQYLKDHMSYCLDTIENWEYGRQEAKETFNQLARTYNYMSKPKKHKTLFDLSDSE